MQNIVSRVGRAVTAAVAGGSGTTAADCRARAAPPSSTPSFLSDSATTSASSGGDDFEIIDAAAASSSSSTTASQPLSDEVSADEVSEAIDIVMQNLPAAAEAAAALENAPAAAPPLLPPPSPPLLVALSGSASPVSSNGGAASHMRDAEEALAVEAQRIRTQETFRATLTHLLSNREVRAACTTALTQSPEFAQALLQIDEKAGGGAGTALADLYPIAARAALAAAAARGGANGDDSGDGSSENNNPLAAAVADALSALSSAKDILAGAAAVTVGLMLEAGVHIVMFTRHLGRLARGEETGAWMSVEGEGRGRRRIARGRSSRSSRASFGFFRPTNLDEWVKLVSAVAMAVVAVIFVRRRGGGALPRGVAGG